MSEFKRLLQDYVNMDYAILVCSAKESYRKLHPVFMEHDPENSGIILTLALISAAVTADGVFSETEKEFILDVFDIPAGKVDIFGQINIKGINDLVDNIADSLSTEHKRELLNIIITVAACDETITRSENSFIQRIMIQN